MNITKKLFSFRKKEVAFFFAHSRIQVVASGLKLYALRSHDFWLKEFPDSHNAEFGKILIITPGRSGNACERNLFRRRVKAIYYEEKLYLNKGIFALYAFREGTACDYLTLKNFLAKTLSQPSLVQPLP